MWAVVVVGLILGVFGVVAEIDLESERFRTAFFVTLAIVGVCVWLYVRSIEKRHSAAYARRWMELSQIQRDAEARWRMGNVDEIQTRADDASLPKP